MEDVLDLLKEHIGLTQYSSSEVITPRKVVEDMVALLPVEVFNPNTKFLDPACKSGRYLIAIRGRLLESDSLIEAFPDEAERSQHILDNQLFGLVTSRMAATISRKALYNDPKHLGNLRYINDYVSLVANKGTDYKALIGREFGADMKFDVVIGNPPYQDPGGKASIYNKFVDVALDIADKVCMITRDNWLNGKAFKSMRNNLISKGSVTDIVHYPEVGEVFSTVDVSVVYFLWKHQHGLATNYTCIRQGDVQDTLQFKFSAFGLYKSEVAKNIILKVGAFGEWAECYNTRSYPFMDQRKRFGLDTMSEQDPQHTIKVIANKEHPVYTSELNFRNTNEVSQYNVMCGVIVNEANTNKPGNVLTNILVLNPYEVSSETWSLIATFKDDMQANNCVKYIKTKFVRFLANQSVNGRSNVTDNTVELVPNQNFTFDSDIDWSQSITDIDKQLYQKYNLTQEEIDYIESTIKPMS